MNLCNLAQYPCCKDHHDKCVCCGDPSERILRKGKRPGAFCQECYLELFKGIIPKNETRGRGSKARLRYRQDMA